MRITHHTAGRLITLPLFLAAIIFTPMTQAKIDSESAQTQQFYENALQRFNNKDFEGSIIQLKNVLQSEPNNLPARILLGQSYLRTFNFPVAEQELSTALVDGADPNLVVIELADARLKLHKFKQVTAQQNYNFSMLSDKVKAKLLTLMGIAYTRQNQYESAGKSFSQAALLAPKDPSPLFAAASLAFNRGDLFLANEFLTKIERLIPNSAELWQLKARFAEAEGLNEQALVLYDKALSINPKLATATTYKTHTLMTLGLYQEAADLIEPLYNKDSFDPEISYAYALALTRTGQAGDARLVLREASAKLNSIDEEVKSNYPNFQILSAMVAFQRGELDLAEKYASLALERFPQHADLRAILAETFLRLNRVKDALATLKPIVYQPNISAGVLALYSHLLLLDGQYSEANRILEQVVQKAPNASSVLADLGLSQLALGNVQSGTQSLEQAMATEAGIGRGGFLLAYTQLRQQKTQEAERTAQQLIQKSPNNPIALNLLAMAQIALDKTEAAQKNLQKALTIEPNYLHAILSYAKLEISAGKYDEAQVRLKAALNDMPSETHLMAALANLSEITGDEQSAILWLEKIRNTDRKQLTLALKLLDIYLSRKEPEKALVISEQLVEEFPENISVFIAQARAEMASGKPGYARSTLRKVLHFRNLNGPKLLQLAQWQRHVGDVSGAVLALNDATSTYPDFVPAVIELIKLETDLDNYNRAHELLDQLKAQFPKNASLHSLRAHVFVRAAQPRKALKESQRAIALQPNAQLALQLSQIQMRLGNTNDAIRLLEDWETKVPDNLPIKNSLAAAYQQTGKLNKAKGIYLRLTEKHPNHAIFHNNLAMAYLELKDPKSLQIAKRAYQLAPESPIVLDTYGWVLSQNSKPEEGLKYLREAYSRASSEPSVGYHIAKTLSLLGQNIESKKTLQALLNQNENFDDRAKAELLLEQLSQN